MNSIGKAGGKAQNEIKVMVLEYIPVIPTLQKLKEEGDEFKVSLDHIGRPFSNLYPKSVKVY